MGKRSFGNYFAFRWMITPDIIRIAYVLGMIILNLAFLGSFIAGSIFLYTYLTNSMDTLYVVLIILGAAVVSLIMSFLVNILFRMFCEQIILFFSIHETLVSVEESNRWLSHDIKDSLNREKTNKPPPPPKA